MCIPPPPAHRVPRESFPSRKGRSAVSQHGLSRKVLQELAERRIFFLNSFPLRHQIGVCDHPWLAISSNTS